MPNSKTPAANVIIQITFKNTEATEALKTYAESKLRPSLDKFVHRQTEAHVVLSVEKNRQIAEIFFHCDGHDFTGLEESPDLYASIDALADSITMQLRKHKERTKKHH